MIAFAHEKPRLMLPRSPEAVRKAARVLGGQVALADAIGCSQPTVSEMASGGRPVPAEMCPLIEQATRKVAEAQSEPWLIVTCEELRPDIQWSVLRSHPATSEA